jgi:WD40 repeat protein
MRARPVAENPYVGPRPFEPGEGAFFFGREREVQELLSLVVAHRVVLLYAASGAGKTSLLNAGLGPLLDGEEGFELLPPARVRALSATDPPADANAYAFGVLTHLIPEAELAGRPNETLADVLSRREHPIGEDGFPAPRALVVDQLEEVFTLYQERWSEREAFFRQLAEALEADPLLRIVLAIREDYVAHLDPFARLLPSALRTRTRLERLGREAALRAATEPARRAGRPFAPGVAEKLVGDLLEMRVDTGGGQTRPVPGEYVEPVQLQVACRSLWSRLPTDATEITEEHRLVFGDVDQVLSQFYEETLAAAAVRGNVKGDYLRERFAAAFITPLETRGTVYWTPTTTAGMPAEAIEEMDRRHLIRAEVRAGARWYELTHDRLIGPVRASNRARHAAIAARRRRRGAIAIGALVLVLASALGLVLAFRPDRASGGPTAAGERALLDEVKQQAQGISSLALILHAQGGSVLGTSFAPDDHRVLTLSDAGTVQIWTTVDGQRMASFQAADVDTASFPAAGYPLQRGTPVLLVKTGGTAVVRTQSGKLLAALPAGRIAVPTPRFTSRGPAVVAADTAGRAVFWDGKTVIPLRGSAGVLMADASLDGRRVITATGSRIDVWTTAGRHLRRLRPGGAAFPPILSRDGTRLAAADSRGTVRVWDTGTGAVLTSLRNEGRSVTRLALSSDGKTFATAGDTKTAWITAVSGKTLALHGPARVNDVALSPNGALAITAHDNGTARVWDSSTGKALSDLVGHGGGFLRTTFSQKGRLLATASDDGTARIWGTAADLQVTEIALVSQKTTRLTVRNAGNGPSVPTAVELLGRDGGRAQKDVATLAPGAHTRVRFTTAFEPLSARVDPDNVVPELDEDNNQRFLGRRPQPTETTQTVPAPGTSMGPGIRPPSTRLNIVGAAEFAAAHASRVHYTQGPQRMSGVRSKVQLPSLPPYEDTSSFVTWCYWQAGAPDPSELSYNGFEWSGSLIARGRVVTSPRPGDIAFYGPSTRSPKYVAIYVGDGKAVAHRRATGPQVQRAKQPDFLQFRSYLP